MKRRIPLAWRQLSREKARMLVAIAGIGFADVLMFLQMGFRSALFNGAVQFHESLQGEIVLVSSRYKSLVSLDQFSERRLYQVLGYSGVQSVSSIYLDFAKWKNPDTKDTWDIFAIGINPDEQVVNLPGVQEHLHTLKEPDVVLFDRGSRAEFGPIAQKFQPETPVTTEVQNRQISVVGLFKLGTSFGVNGNIITSDLNFFRLFGQKRQRRLIDVGLIKLKLGVDVDQVVATLQAGLDNDVKVLTKQAFIDQEKSYWNTSTPVGYVFDLGALIGFIVGAVIVYQILYSDVSDHLSEYATLKAIGFRDRYLLMVVFQEAIILAAMGFVPGLAISIGFYHVTRQATLLPMIMTLGRAGFVLVLTMMMCAISAATAVRKLQSADPADVF